MSVSKEELEKRIEEFKAACSEVGIKLTNQRLEIFREIARREDHPDALAVHKAVKKRLPRTSLDTVYRTLWMLKDIGMATAMGTNSDRTLFDANMRKHHHFVCDKCGAARDFYEPQFDALKPPDSAKAFGEVFSARVEVRGVCSRCLDKTKGKRAEREKGDK